MILKDFLLQPLAILDCYVVHIAALNPEFFMLNFTMGFKNVEFDADFDPVKNHKKVTQKVIGQKRLHKDIKVKNQNFPSQWR